MKVAVPVNEKGYINDHFGQCEFYGVYTIEENGGISDVHTIPSLQGCGCKSNIASVLAENGVKTMLAGGIGAGAINVLNNSGIQVVRGCSGYAEEVVRLFAEGKVVDTGDSCHHHEHHHHENNS